MEHSPSSQVSLTSTPSEPGTHSLPEQVWQNVSAPTKVTLGQSPPQGMCGGKLSSSQGAVGFSTSGQKSLGHLSFAQGSQESSTSSHKVVGSSYYQEAVAQFPSVQGGGLSSSAQGCWELYHHLKLLLKHHLLSREL